MLLARVEGRAIATIKHASLQGAKLLLAQPYATDGTTPDGHPLIAIDAVGAGKGDMVILTSDGPTARQWLQSDTTPVRWTVIGVTDA